MEFELDDSKGKFFEQALADLINKNKNNSKIIDIKLIGITGTSATTNDKYYIFFNISIPPFKSISVVRREIII